MQAVAVDDFSRIRLGTHPHRSSRNFLLQHAPQAGASTVQVTSLRLRSLSPRGNVPPGRFSSSLPSSFVTGRFAAVSCFDAQPINQDPGGPARVCGRERA